MKRLKCLLILLSIAMLSSCTGSSGIYSAAQIRVIENLNVPECALPGPDGKKLYISNIDTQDEGYWTDDGKGFISLLASGGEMKELKWINSSSEKKIHAPKGMCILNGFLYFNDNTRLMRCALNDPGNVSRVGEINFIRANDLATDGKSLWLSDIGASIVYCIDPEGNAKKIPAPEGVNGVTCFNGKVFTVSWTLHDVYELDPDGKKDPVPFGLASYFTNLDGIEVLDDGTFIVSDFMGNKICTIGRDRITVRTLIELESPADIGVNRKENMLYVPQLKKNRAVVYKLKQE